MSTSIEDALTNQPRNNPKEIFKNLPELLTQDQVVELFSPYVHVISGKPVLTKHILETLYVKRLLVPYINGYKPGKLYNHEMLIKLARIVIMIKDLKSENENKTIDYQLIIQKVLRAHRENSGDD